MTIKEISVNRQANYLYNIIDKLEVGIVLSGTEVKSIREGKINLKDSFAIVKNGEVIIKNMHISEYEFGNINNKNPIRDRKLLLHKSEIFKMVGYIKQDGYSLVPLSVYFKGRNVKILLGIGKGKKIYDKRETIKERDAKRQIKKEI